MRKHLCLILLPLTLAACKPHPAPPPAAKLPFDISPQTTAITSPLRPDGTPDYAAALNQKYGAHITPQNNGFLLILQAFGTDLIDAKYRAELLTLCGSPECQPPSPAWETYGGYLTRLDPEGSKKIPYEQFTEDDAASKSPWTRNEHAKVAGYLDAHAAQFDLIAKAVRMPQFWEPIPTTAPSWYLPASTINFKLREATYVLRIRAMLHLGSNDFDGFLTDVQTIKHAARCLAADPALIYKLMALYIENTSNQLLGTALASGKLSGNQCSQIEATLASFKPLPSLADAWTEYEKWQNLRTAVLVATGDKAALQALKSPDAWLTIDASRVDWNQVLATINTWFEDSARHSKLLSMPELRVKADHDFDRSWPIIGQAIDHALAGKDPEPVQLDPIGSLPGTTREQYTQNVIQSLLIFDTFAAAQLLERECQLRQSLVPPLLALARLHVTTGTWPKTFQDIPPEMRATFPTDPYAAESIPIQYVLSPAGPSLTSVGHDGKPNASSTSHDDIGLGADITLR